MLEGAILAKALYPHKAREIDRIVMRGEIQKLVFIGGFIIIGLIVCNM